MERAWFDFQSALRVLRRSPAFTGIAVLILALGIGANTAIYSLVRGVLLQPLPLPYPDRMVVVCETNPRDGGWCGGSPANVADLAEGSRSLVAAGVGRSNMMLLSLGERPEWTPAGVASPGFFEALGVTAQVGRTFLPEENGVDARPVAVLSDGMWRDRFGADPEIVGRTITLDDEVREIVGVLPAGFQAPRFDRITVWTPLPWDQASASQRSWRGFFALGRLEPGIEMEAAVEELRVRYDALAELHPVENEGYSLGLRSLHDYMLGSTRPTLAAFMGAVVLVLLIGCANLANLLLARGAQRTRELAVRASIGADRRRLIRQLMTESGVLALLGGGLGIALAVWAVDAFVALAPPTIPRLDEVGIGGGVVAFALLTTVATTVVFGLLPALKLTSVDLNSTLRDGGRGGSGVRGGRMRQGLVVAEVAMAFTLVVGAGLLGRSFLSFTRWTPGFETERLLTTQVFAPFSRYPESGDVAQVYMTAREAVAALPGVLSVGMVSAGPLFGGEESSAFSVPDRAELDPEGLPAVRWYDADPHYFATLGLPILRGRGLAETDVAGAVPVAVINETMARVAFGGEDPLGRVILVADRPDPFQVVGVVADVPPFTPGQAPQPEIYWSNRQFPRWGTYFVVRTAGDPGAQVEPIRERFQEVDPTLQLGNVADLQARAGRRLVTPRFNMMLVGVFGLMALVLALAGVYGVMSLTVAMRTREIGIRMALGSDRGAEMGRVVWEGMKLVGLGLGVGLVGAMLASRVLQGLVFGVSTTDGITLGVTAVLVAGAGLIAGALPARRASRVDVMSVLREE